MERGWDREIKREILDIIYINKSVAYNDSIVCIQTSSKRKSGLIF